MPRPKNPQADADTELYRSPGLEKGLDIIEALASEERPLTLSAIVQRLGRSTGELFRIIQVLERRGFVAQGRSGYTLSSKIFELGMLRPPTRTLIELALPIMRRLSADVAQSCHLVFRSAGDMVVLARMESPDQPGFSVRIGYRRPLHQSTSGAAIFAFQPPEIRAEWAQLLTPRPDPAEWDAFEALCEGIRTAGYADMPSLYTAGVFDLAAPIMRGDGAAAVLSIPYVQPLDMRPHKRDVVAALRDTARMIAAELVPGDAPV